MRGSGARVVVGDGLVGEGDDGADVGDPERVLEPELIHAAYNIGQLRA